MRCQLKKSSIASKSQSHELQADTTHQHTPRTLELHLYGVQVLSKHRIRHEARVTNGRSERVNVNADICKGHGDI